MINVPGAEISPLFSMIPIITGAFGIIVSVGLLVFYIILNVRMRNKVNNLIAQNTSKVEILTFQHHLQIKEYKEQTKSYVLPYSQISRVTETENYYIIYLINKGIIVADKNNTQGDVSCLEKVSSLYHKHKKRYIYLYKTQNLSRKKILLTKYASIVLCIASIISLWLSLLVATIPLSTGKIFSELTAFEGNFVKYTMLAFLLVPLSSIIFGAYNNSKGRRTKPNIIIGLIMFSIMGLYSLMFIMPI